MSQPARKPSYDDNHPVALHTRAMDNLQFIRDTMESSSAFTSLPGRGGIVMGVSALLAATLASPAFFADRWLTIWLSDAAVAAAIGAWTMFAKARGSVDQEYRERRRMGSDEDGGSVTADK